MEDATALFYDFDAFGSVLEPGPIMNEIAARSTLGRPLPVGPNPQVAYFAGQAEIVAVETALGTVRALHCPGFPFGGPQGVSIKNEICVTLDFAEPATFSEAFDRSCRILSFLELLIGRQQVIRRLHMTVEDTPLQVHWSHAPQRRLGRHDDHASPHPADLLVMAADEKEEFATILSKWVACDASRREARQRFHGVFVGGNRYGVDRLVAAANVFDILPADCGPGDVPLSAALAKAKRDAQGKFKALPRSYERDSILSALGRVGKPSLKNKAKSRVDVLRKVAPTRFAHLQEVVISQ